MSRYLITGGAGFVGSHLADRLLAEGHDVTVLDDLSSGKRANLSAQVRLVEGCITDRTRVAKAMTDVAGCYHLAAIPSVTRSLEEWSHCHRVNLAGAVQVMDEAARQAIPIVYASSAAVYGAKEAEILSEDEVPAPISPYGWDKWGCEQQAALMAQHRGLRSAGVRFFNLYGPRQDPSSPYSGVISIFMARARAGQAMTIYGDGLQTRDFVYVADAVRLLIQAMGYLSGASGTSSILVNGCSQRKVTVREMAEQIGHIADHPHITHSSERAGDIRHSCGSRLRAFQLLNFQTEVPLEEGLKRLWDA